MVLRLSDFWSNLNLKMLVFEERGKSKYPEKNRGGGARERADNKLNPHMASTPGFELGPRWWEGSALTTAPSLSPQMMCTYSIMNVSFCSERTWDICTKCEVNPKVQ